MANTAKILEFQSVDHAVESFQSAKASRSEPLGRYELDELYGYKVINKATYIQLAIAHDYGVMVDPQLDSNACERFAEKWSREAGEITASDMRKAIDKLKTAIFKNEPENDKFPQLNLFD